MTFPDRLEPLQVRHRIYPIAEDTLPDFRLAMKYEEVLKVHTYFNKSGRHPLIDIQFVEFSPAGVAGFFAIGPAEDEILRQAIDGEARAGADRKDWRADILNHNLSGFQPREIAAILAKKLHIRPGSRDGFIIFSAGRFHDASREGLWDYLRLEEGNYGEDFDTGLEQDPILSAILTEFQPRWDVSYNAIVRRRRARGEEDPLLRATPKARQRGRGNRIICRGRSHSTTG